MHWLQDGWVNRLYVGIQAETTRYKEVYEPGVADIKFQRPALAYEPRQENQTIYYSNKTYAGRPRLIKAVIIHHHVPFRPAEEFRQKLDRLKDKAA